MQEKGLVSGLSFSFSILCFMLGTILRTAFIFVITENDSWAMPLSGLIFSLLFAAIYAALLNRHPGKSLFEINDIVLGPVVGKLVSSLYLFFFLTLTALNTHDLGDFVEGYTMLGTPFIAITLFFLVACAYTIRKGVENLVFLSTFLTIIIISSVFINFLMVLKDIDFKFLKPFFQLSPMKYVQATITVAALPLGEVLAFTMIAPMLSKRQKTGKPFVFGLVLSALTMSFVIMRDSVTLGPLAANIALPSFEAVRYINLAGILTRMESVYAVILILSFLFKVCVLLYASVLGLSQLLNFSDPKKLTLPCTAFTLFYTLFVYKSSMENSDWGATTAPIFSLTFEFVLPVITLIVMLLKGLRKKREASI